MKYSRRQVVPLCFNQGLVRVGMHGSWCKQGSRALLFCLALAKVGPVPGLAILGREWWWESSSHNKLNRAGDRTQLCVWSFNFVSSGFLLVLPQIWLAFLHPALQLEFSSTFNWSPLHCWGYKAEPGLHFCFTWMHPQSSEWSCSAPGSGLGTSAVLLYIPNLFCSSGWNIVPWLSSLAIKSWKNCSSSSWCFEVKCQCGYYSLMWLCFMEAPARTSNPRADKSWCSLTEDRPQCQQSFSVAYAQVTESGLAIMLLKYIWDEKHQLHSPQGEHQFSYRSRTDEEHILSHILFFVGAA